MIPRIIKINVAIHWCLILQAILIISCSSSYLVTAIEPITTKAPARNRIKVMIKLSSKSLLRNRIAIINRSTEKIAVYPIDIILRIPEMNVVLPAVMDYKKYVSMRNLEGFKKCLETDSPQRCQKSIDKFLKRFLRVRPFRFGEIPPRKKNFGYFAFNLPDPLNVTAEAKKTTKIFLNAKRTLNGKIVVTVSSVELEPQKTEFVFPVKVITSSDKGENLLNIMKIF